MTNNRQQRLGRVQQAMQESDTDVLLLSVGSDLPWLTGYRAMPLERLTMLIVDQRRNPVLVVPELEAPRVDVENAGIDFGLRPWSETEDPVAIVASIVGESASTIAIDDRTWSTFVLQLQASLPEASFISSSSVCGPIRAVKDDHEIELLKVAAQTADLVATDLQRGHIELVGRTEAEVSADIAQRLVSRGHQKHNFSIVAAGENAASPHHDAGNTIIEKNQLVLFDFGGTLDSYCSDMTRMVFTGSTPPPEITDAYAVLFEAQQAATRAATAGMLACDVDATAREIIASAGFGDNFIHRTGHGIGCDEHEDPYIVQSNSHPLAVGNVFSIEPGIYLPGRWGMRLEDIVACTASGPVALNTADRALVCLG